MNHENIEPGTIKEAGKKTESAISAASQLKMDTPEPTMSVRMHAQEQANHQMKRVGCWRGLFSGTQDF